METLRASEGRRKCLHPRFGAGSDALVSMRGPALWVSKMETNSRESCQLGRVPTMEVRFILEPTMPLSAAQPKDRLDHFRPR